MSPNRLRRLRLLSVCAVLLTLAFTHAAGAVEPAYPKTHLRIIGNLANANQYTNHEMPFWTRRIAERSGGQVTAEISPFDQSGILGRDMMRLLRLGVVQFGTTQLSNMVIDAPELGALDLPLLSPDFSSLRRTLTASRPFIQDHLRDHYDLKLLGIYAYPAQVLFCRNAFTDLASLAGRRIRTANVAQSELVEALGATPIVTSFGEVVPSIRRGAVECAITGTMSGNSAGLHEVTTHIHELAITWGVAVFAANGTAWRALPPAVAEFLRREIAQLEAEILDAAERETDEGLACNTGAPACASGRKGRMVRVPTTPADADRIRSLIVGTVLPGWLGRCGDGCISAWNTSLGPLLSIPAPRG
ncbi:MAG TPA: TRAP transporter substrate-binding protein [Azospirillaceae bacterium]|nr:TRAP transporter substrate-binding protein [Azospirillaceae bacterium]